METVDTLKRWKTYQLWTAACAVLLLAVTWKLWTPQTVFPQVPLFAWAIPLGAWVDWLGLALMLIALLSQFLPKNRLKIGNRFWVVFTVGWLVSVLVDQHRLQPWAYQFAILAIFYSALPSHEGLRWSRALTISIYAYSAVSKLDAQFLHTVGQDFLRTLAGFIWIDTNLWTESQRTWATAIFPLFELLVALLLISWKTRKLGLWGALLLHVSLLLILGPLGLNHSWGVLAWNLFFIGQTILLFGGEKQTSPAEKSANAAYQTFPRRLAKAVGIFVMLFPLGERYGYCDHWLAWALYAPHSSRVDLLVALDDFEKTPTQVKRFFNQHGQWMTLDLSKWSLETLLVPVYPQARFQFGVIQKVSNATKTTGQKMLHKGIAQRISGKRDQTSIPNTDNTPLMNFTFSFKPRS